MKVALVHDQLQEFGGAERVLVYLHQIFKNADIYTSFYNKKKLGKHAKHFEGWNIITSWSDKIPIIKKLYSPFRFITPYIWSSFDFSSYDLVISSSGSYMSKGIITKPNTLHICYLHHPPRYLYYYQTAREWQKYWPIRAYGHFINHNLRMYDFLSSQRVNFFLANSEETKKRILKFYRRDAEVIYPPVYIPSSRYTNSKMKKTNEGYYITVSRLEKPKNIDLLIKVANKKGFKLVIVGTGRDENRLKSIAGNNVSFTGSVSDKKLQDLYSKAKAFLFASQDDEFGISPIEAMSYGLPVIAYFSGGLKETVKQNKNGFLYGELNEESLIEAINKLELLDHSKYLIMSDYAIKESKIYSESEFKRKILSFINNKLKVKK